MGGGAEIQILFMVTIVTEIPDTVHRLKLKNPQHLGSCICIPLQVK